MYGLSVRQWRQIFAILSRYGNRIDWVKLFGSRARGDYKPVSDVDLAIASTENLVTPLQLDFDQSQLPFTFDLIDYRRHTLFPYTTSISMQPSSVLNLPLNWPGN